MLDACCVRRRGWYGQPLRSSLQLKMMAPRSGTDTPRASSGRRRRRGLVGDGALGRLPGGRVLAGVHLRPPPRLLARGHPARHGGGAGVRLVRRPRLRGIRLWRWLARRVWWRGMATRSCWSCLAARSWAQRQCRLLAMLGRSWLWVRRVRLLRLRRLRFLRHRKAGGRRWFGVASRCWTRQGGRVPVLVPLRL